MSARSSQTGAALISVDPQPPRSVPLGTIALLVISAALYVAMLGSISFSAGGGDASFGQAIASFFLTVACWIALAVLFFAAAIMGNMPRAAKVTAIFLIPLAGVATFVAIDMCSRHMKWAVIFPVVLPLLIAFYSAWARFPKLHAMLPARQTSIGVLGIVFVLSVAALLLAM